MPDSIKQFFTPLRRLGFVRTHRTHTLGMPHLYERESVAGDGKLVVTVQTWPDGRHRVSHIWGGYGVVLPTYFRDLDGMYKAIRRQTELVERTQAHVRSLARGAA
jgi:hypothetical protein